MQCIGPVYNSPNFRRNVFICAAVTLAVAAVALAILYLVADKRATEISLNRHDSLKYARGRGHFEGGCLAAQQELAYLKQCKPTPWLPDEIRLCERTLADYEAELAFARQQLSPTQSLLSAAAFWKRIGHIAAGGSLGCVALAGIFSLATVHQHNKNSNFRKRNYVIALVAISLLSIAIVSVLLARAHSAKNAWSFDRCKQTGDIKKINKRINEWCTWANKQRPDFSTPSPGHPDLDSWDPPFPFYARKMPFWTGDVAELQEELAWYNHWESLNKLARPTFLTSVVALPILALTALGGILYLAATRQKHPPIHAPHQHALFPVTQP